MGVGPIPWTATNDFCKRSGIDGDDQADFEYLIEKMDEAYMKHASEKAEKQKSLQTREAVKGQTTARRR